MTKHIVKVEHMPASFQKWAVVLPCGSRVLQPELLIGTSLRIAGLAEVEQTSEEVNGTLRHTTTLTATLRQPHAEVFSALMRQPVSLRLTAADGTQYIMGLTSAPHPSIRLQDRRGARPAEQAAVRLTATWTGIHPLLEVVKM